MPLGEAPGGGDDVEEMIAFIREEKPFREQKLERMVNAYRDELAMLKKIAWSPTAVMRVSPNTMRQAHAPIA